MIVMNNYLFVKRWKNLEFLQILEQEVNELQHNEECLNFKTKRKGKLNDRYCLSSEWKNKSSLLEHIQSEVFSLMLSAATVLCYKQEIVIASQNSKTIIELTHNVHDYDKTKTYDKLRSAIRLV